MANAKLAPPPATAPAADPAPVAKAQPHKPPLSMAQQRFILIVLLVIALLGSLYVVATRIADHGMQTAVLAIIGTALVGPLRDAFRHFFPGGQADQGPNPAK